MVFMGIEFTTAELVIALFQLLNTILLLVLLGKLPRKESREELPSAGRMIPLQQEKDDDLEIVAVLAAAIAEFEGTEPDKVKIADFRQVRNDDRAGYRSNWSIVGRREQINRYI